MSDKSRNFVVSFRGAGNTIKTAVHIMKLYFIQDEKHWMSEELFKNPEQAIEKSQTLLGRKPWEDTQYFDIYEVDTKIMMINSHLRVTRTGHIDI